MNKELILFMGIPASGKSTFYKTNFFPHYLYISLDQLHSRFAEAELFQFALRRERSCVIDNTNITRSGRAAYLQLAKAAGFKVRGYCFLTNKADALARNAQRSGRACVPEVAIRAMYAQFEYPTLSEGFDELSFVRLQDNTFNVEPYNEKYIK